MNSGTQRIFSFKNEELPVIAGFTAINLERDLDDFTTFSPVFNLAYLTAYKAKIEAVRELVLPYSETVEGKIVTEHIETILQELIELINYLEGYLNLAGKTIPLNPADFGLVQLRKSVHTRDLDEVLNMIRPVKNNMDKYKTELSAKGMTEAFVTKFTQAGLSLADDKNKRYIMVSGRAALVQNNMVQLNDLFMQMKEICKIGKTLYKRNDKAKQNDYTIAYLLKQVHRTAKPSDNAKQQAAKTIKPDVPKQD